MTDLFVESSPLDPRARVLIDDLHQEYESRYGNLLRAPGEPPEMLKYPPEVFARPHGFFGLLLRNGVTVAGGAFKRFDADTAEFKRIWTHAALRRQGLAQQVIEGLEAQAWQQGYRRIYLTTGFRQPEAVALYLQHGYTALFDPHEDPDVPRSLPFEKWLTPSHQHARVLATN